MTPYCFMAKGGGTPAFETNRVGMRPVFIGMANCPVRLTAMLLVAALLALSAPSQQQKPTEDVAPTIRVEVDVVNILATVRDKRGALINNLSKDDFILTENRHPQQIKYFARETDLPLTIGLLLDVSGSQGHLIDIEREAAYQFFSNVLREQDRAFLISFAGEVELLQDFTGSPRLLQAALGRLRVAGGTLLYDAVYLAATDRLLDQTGRKAIVLITDGIDTNSQRTLGQAIKAAQQADIVIYSIRYFDLMAYSDDSFSQYTDVMASALRTMSEETGGRVFYVDKRHSLSQVFDELQQEIHSQYAIGYTPTNENL